MFFFFIAVCFLKISTAYTMCRFAAFYGNINVCMDYQIINVICFTFGAILLAGSCSSSLELMIYSHPESLRDPKSACICCRTATNVFEGTEVILWRRITDTGPLCVTTNQWKDAHGMPWAPLMLICAQPWRRWRRSKWRLPPSQMHNFFSPGLSMEACEATEMEQMERLQFTDFMLSLH